MSRLKPSLTAAALVLAAGLGAGLTDLSLRVCETLELPLVFRVRQALGRAPALDPRIKILAYDDASVAELGRPEMLGVTRWSALLAELAATAPKVVLLDAVLGSPLKPSDDRRAIAAALDGPGTRIVTGMIARPVAAAVNPIDLNKPAFHATSDTTAFAAKYGATFGAMVAYGPPPELDRLAAKLGSLSNREPEWVMPAAVLAPGRLVPHLSLRAADAVELKGDQLWVDGAEVPLLETAEALVNWPSVDELFGRTVSFADAIRRLRAGDGDRFFAKGDIIMVLPMMYSGNGDQKATSLGPLSGGYVHVATVNSVLEGRWLGLAGFGAGQAFWTLLAALLAGATLWPRSNRLGLLAVLGINLAAAVVAPLALLAARTVVNVALPLLLLDAVSLSGLLVKLAVQEVRAIRLAENLRGIVPPQLLAKAQANRYRLTLAPTEQVVTAMFIDIVGFSLAAEAMSPRSVFDRLKGDLAMLISTIHRHGGIVDKTLGDGLLGFFGYDPFAGETTRHHADQALACAIEIQRTIAARVVALADPRDPAFPVRIGLNTGVVLVGNLGHQGKIEITVIGHTINMAKRYEDACEPYKIILGAATRAGLAEAGHRERLTLRYTQIKHHAELIETFECDPFADAPALLQAAMQAYRDRAGLRRDAERRLVAPETRWEIWHQGERVGSVIDYSTTGLCVELDRLYAAKVMLCIDLKIVRKDGSGHELSGLYAHVRWGYATGKKYYHGLRFSDESISRLGHERVLRLAA